MQSFDKLVEVVKWSGQFRIFGSFQSFSFGFSEIIGIRCLGTYSFKVGKQNLIDFLNPIFNIVIQITQDIEESENRLSKGI